MTFLTVVLLFPSLPGFSTTDKTSEDGVDIFYMPKAGSADAEPGEKTKDHSKGQGSSGRKLSVEDGTTSVALFSVFCLFVASLSLPVSVSVSVALTFYRSFSPRLSLSSQNIIIIIIIIISSSFPFSLCSSHLHTCLSVRLICLHTCLNCVLVCLSVVVL